MTQPIKTSGVFPQTGFYEYQEYLLGGNAHPDDILYVFEESPLPPMTVRNSVMREMEIFFNSIDAD